MEHHLPRPQHLAIPGFFNLCATHFPCGGGCGFAAPLGINDFGLAGDLMQLSAGCVGMAGDDDHPAWPCGGGGGSSHDLPLGGDGDGNLRLGEEGAAELPSDEPPRDGGGNNVSGTRKRRDRAKTIVLERKRRSRMQEKLYELRALVPNITKMDKASIIADAVDYVRNLQAHAARLREELAALEAPPRSSSADQEPPATKRQDAAAGGGGGRRHGARVWHVGAARVGEGRFFVTVECERRDGVAAPLCAAVESLACFRVESSSLGRSAPDRVVSTATLKATCQVEAARIGEGTVKLLLMAALGEEGFAIEPTAGIS